MKSNEHEMRDPEQYATRREKLIGKTLEMVSALDEALKHFISQVADEPTRSFLERKLREVSSIYDHSALNNLRILQQTIWDFERLFGVLTERHQQNDQAMTILLRLFFALSFDLKSGRLQTTDLASRSA